MNHYDLLEVPRDADDDTIKQAYRRKAMQHHPDRQGGDEEIMQLIQSAYDVLSDADKRARYDRGEEINTGPTKEQQFEQEVIGTLVQLFTQIVNSLSMDEVRLSNPLDKVSGHLKQLIQGLPKQLKAVKKELRKLKEVKRRLSGGQFYLHDHLNQQRRAHVMTLLNARRQKRVWKRVLEHVKELKYEIDQDTRTDYERRMNENMRAIEKSFSNLTNPFSGGFTR